MSKLFVRERLAFAGIRDLGRRRVFHSVRSAPHESGGPRPSEPTLLSPRDASAYWDHGAEFVSPAGTVFAVSWQGFAPDLRQLLGEHFDEYVQAARNRSGRRGRGLHIETGDMVFDSGGHMRVIIGRAYPQQSARRGL